MIDSRKAVFLSYASEDSEAAARICAVLRNAGLEVWFDQSELRGGDAWDRNIRKQIHDCALFVAVISAHSNARNEGYFRREWRLAVDRTHDMADDSPFLVPVVIDDTSETTARVPDAFREIQWTKLPGGATPPAFAQHVARLLASLDAVGASVSVPRAPAATAARHTPVAKRRLPSAPVWAGGAIVLIAIGYLVQHRYSATSSKAPGPAATPVDLSTPLSTAPPQAVITPKSVAVLPFADMSERHDQGYFADGMAEEIIERLVKVPELHVPARASSFYFKDKPTKPADIARELGVANLLEGSVRKSGDHLRIGAQLVRVKDGSTVWSESFDRKLADVFAIQDEIATSVATALQITLTGGSLTREHGGTRNLEAYQLYLRAQSYNNENTAEGLDADRKLLERAIAMDPEFGLAVATLATVWLVYADTGQVSPAEGYGHARKLATQAIAVSPELAGPHSTLGYVWRTYDWNWPESTAELKRALALDPNDGGALMMSGLLAQTLGQFAEAERLLRAAVALDPLFSYANFNLANSLYLAGHYPEAEAVFRRVLATTPDFTWTRPFLAKTLVVEGRAQEALTVMQPVINDDGALLYSPIILRASGRKLEAEAALQRLIKEQASVNAFYVAQYYAYVQDNDRAMQWLERAYAQRDSGLIEIVGEPMLRNLWSDPRYRAFLRKMKLPEP